MVRLILVFAIAVSTAACSVSKSTNYYVLTANSDTPAVQVSTVFEDQPSLGVGPVSVPEYLQRSQIVYSMMGNQLTVSSANQWSEPLNSAIVRVVTSNLSRLTPAVSIRPFPWRSDSKPEMVVRIALTELNRRAAEEAKLVADWVLVDTESKQVIHRARFSQSARVSGFSYSKLVQAYSDLLAALSRDISEAIEKRG